MTGGKEALVSCVAFCKLRLHSIYTCAAWHGMAFRHTYTCTCTAHAPSPDALMASASTPHRIPIPPHPIPRLYRKTS